MANEDDVVIVYGEPVGKARPRTVTVNGFVQTFTPKSTREYEAKVKKAYKQQCGKLYTKDFTVRVHIKAICKIPKSFSKIKSISNLYLFKTTIILHFIWLGEPGLCLMKEFNCNRFQCNTAPNSRVLQFNYASISRPYYALHGLPWWLRG